MLKLDFSLETSAERSAYVNQHFDPYGTYYTKKELETIANYIIFGKDADGTSAVDRKEIQVQTKHNTYKKKEPESLEALIEQPTFDEREILTGETRYKHPKPTIDREKDADVPGIKELWAQIDEVQHLIEANTGKVDDPTARKLTERELYEFKHLLVELRRQQFILKDMVKPTICRIGTGVRNSFYETSKTIPWDEEGTDFAIAPLGLYAAKPERFDDPRSVVEKDYHYNENAKTILDFRNPDHLYEIFENWLDLEEEGKNESDSLLLGILETVSWYVRAANLTPVQEEILELKKKKWKNEKIEEQLYQKFKVTHSTNYISTIYKQQICGKVAEAAITSQEYYENREILTAWKKCRCCGKWKLNRVKDFSRRSRNADGFASICKVCESEKRKEKKGGSN